MIVTLLFITTRDRKSANPLLSLKGRIELSIEITGTEKSISNEKFTSIEITCKKINDYKYKEL